MSSQPRVTLIGKPGCHLCDQARVVISVVCAETGDEFSELSIFDDLELMDRYAEDIPVTLVDGKRHDFFRVNPDRLRKALSQPAS